MKTRKHNKRGTAMLHALGMMMILSIGIATSWKYLIATMDQNAYNRHQAEARHIAESGAYAALDSLEKDPSLTQLPLTPFANGVYSADISRTSGLHSLHITGRLGEAPPYRSSYVLEVLVSLDAQNTSHILRWEKGEQP